MWPLTLLIMQGLHGPVSPPAVPRLELLLMQADVVGLGKLTRQVDPVNLLDQQGKSQSYICGELVLTRLFKPAEGTATVRVALDRADVPHPDVDALLGRELLWLLRKVPGSELYRAEQGDQRRPADQVDRVRALLAQLGSVCSWGPAQGGLQACAALLEGDGEPQAAAGQLAFAVRNVSDHLLRLCTHPEKTRLRLVDADTGQPLPVSLYKWLKRARIRPVSPSDFEPLDPGQVLILNEFGARLEPIAELPRPLAELARRIRIDLTAEANGSEFGLQDVWTGDVSSGPVQTQPPSSRPAEPPAQP